MVDAAQWCGGFGPAPWLPGGKGVSPCWQETAVASLLIAIGAPLLILAARRARAATAPAPPCAPGCRKRGMTGGETAYLILATALAAIHLTHLVAASFVLEDLPFHIAYHAALTLLWAAAAVVQRRVAVARPPALLRLLPFVAVAEAGYLWDVYTMFAAYLGTGSFPRAYIKSRWAACCALGGQVAVGVGVSGVVATSRENQVVLLPPPTETATNHLIPNPGSVWSAMMESVFAGMLLAIEVKRLRTARAAAAGEDGYQRLGDVEEGSEDEVGRCCLDGLICRGGPAHV
jgi:hypothetical protein